MARLFGGLQGWEMWADGEWGLYEQARWSEMW